VFPLESLRKKPFEKQGKASLELIINFIGSEKFNYQSL